MKSADALAERIRPLLPAGAIVERNMFGAVCFMLEGNMLVAAMKGGELLVRTEPGREQWALAQPGVAMMLMGGREMTGFVGVSGPAIDDDSAIAGWIAFAEPYVRSLPSK